MSELPLIAIGGLLGASHCLGMCGGFALTIGLGARSPAKNTVRQLIYSAGRIFTYAFLGAAAGFAGSWFASRSGPLIHAQAVLSFLAGGFLVVQGGLALGLVPGRVRRWGQAGAGAGCLAGSFLGPFLTSPRWYHVFIAGMLNGLLPCGLVYGYLALASSRASLPQGLLAMAAFGTGTVPMMVLAGLGASTVSLAARRRLVRLAGVCVLVTGLGAFARGVAFCHVSVDSQCPGCQPADPEPVAIPRSVPSRTGSRFLAVSNGIRVTFDKGTEETSDPHASWTSPLSPERTTAMERTLVSLVLVLATIAPRAARPAAATESLTVAGNGAVIPHPSATTTYPVTDGPRTVQVPENMLYVPAGKFTVGTGQRATTAELDGYCIGKFSVTNAEFKAFLEATGSRRFPSYWAEGTYPEGKANHPVVYVSLTNARAYADWVSETTGWKVAIPTSQQWEKAARGPDAFLYPWGNSAETRYVDGVLTTRFNSNAVTVAEFLKDHPRMEVTYNNKKSRYLGVKTTVDRIAGYDEEGKPTYLSLGASGSVRGWVNHATYTGFIYTDLFSRLNAEGGNTRPVGSYEAGKSAYGCYDMAGNVWNWCDSLIVATNGAEKGRTVNEIRGGSWYAMGNSARSVSIGEGRAASGAYNTVGFRIVMLPEAER